MDVAEKGGDLFPLLDLFRDRGHIHFISFIFGNRKKGQLKGRSETVVSDSFLRCFLQGRVNEIFPYLYKMAEDRQFFEN